MIATHCASSDWATLLGGSWVVISGVISPLIWVIILATLLITPHYKVIIYNSSYLTYNTTLQLPLNLQVLHAGFAVAFALQTEAGAGFRV